MSVAGWDEEGGLGGGVGVLFVKGMEPSGCRQTDWGNTWHKSQINKHKREKERGRETQKKSVREGGLRNRGGGGRERKRREEIGW